MFKPSSIEALYLRWTGGDVRAPTYCAQLTGPIVIKIRNHKHGKIHKRHKATDMMIISPPDACL